MIKIVVLLEIKDRDAFLLFEQQAIAIMRKYEGKLVAAFEPEKTESSTTNVAEVHYLKFPSIQAYRKYKQDPKLMQLSALREQAIANTTVFVSGKLIDYS